LVKKYKLSDKSRLPIVSEKQGRIAMTVTRRTLLGSVAASLAASTLPVSAQGDWPSRLVRLISPYGPGGANDISLRILAGEFSRRLNQQFVVENKAGAGTRIANDLVAHAASDGYTTPRPMRLRRRFTDRKNTNARTCRRWRWRCSRRFS
jgi:hypothetical protein